MYRSNKNLEFSFNKLRIKTCRVKKCFAKGTTGDQTILSPQTLQQNL